MLVNSRVGLLKKDVVKHYQIGKENLSGGIEFLVEDR